MVKTGIVITEDEAHLILSRLSILATIEHILGVTSNELHYEADNLIVKFEEILDV